MKKSDRNAIYQVLFHSGVLFAERSPQKHHPDEDLKHLTNLQVIKTLQSLKSRGYVSEQCAWRHYYWKLNNDGIDFLRGSLQLPAEVVPTTLQRRHDSMRVSRAADDARPRAPRDGKERDDRSNYRRQEREGDKTGTVGIGTGSVQFRGGFGRGKK